MMLELKKIDEGARQCGLAFIEDSFIGLSVSTSMRLKKQII